MARKKKASLTKNQLDILYECWKEGTDTQERLALIEQHMPKVPTLKALKIMRRMAKVDTKWLKWTTRQKNLKEKEKLDKEKEKQKVQAEKERRKNERERRKRDKEEKKQERVQQQNQKSQKELITKHIESSLADDLEKRIPMSFFFCPDTHQFVNNISCIFRIFSEDFSFGNSCDKCKRMDKHIPILKEIIDGRSAKGIKKQRTKRDQASSGRSKDEVQKPSSAKAKTTGAKGGTKRPAAAKHVSGKHRASNRRGS